MNVGCERPDGTFIIHPELETCEMCNGSVDIPLGGAVRVVVEPIKPPHVSEIDLYTLLIERPARHERFRSRRYEGWSDGQ